MPAVQQWGRRESIIWPPRRYLYTLGAIFLALVATGFFVYVRFQFGLSPLERYYLPYYLRTELAGLTHPTSNYQLLYISDRKSRPRTALEADVEPGATPQPTGGPLPLVLSSEARRKGFTLAVPRATAQLLEQGSPHLDRALGLCGDSSCPALQDATDFWSRGLRASTSIFRSQGYPAHQGTSLRAPPQRPRSCECQGLHRSRQRQRHRHHDERFEATLAYSARCRKQALPDRG